jgi:RNA polymerase sigma-70 factor (ECF subfamily)
VSEAGGPDAFELRRPALLALARRMLGDSLQADDVVVEAWLRWQLGADEGARPVTGLVGLVADLCRREREGAHRRSIVDGDAACVVTVAALDRVSMALVAVVCRLSPPERAVLLLHDVFKLGHAGVAELLGAKEADCRQLHHRAREDVAVVRKMLATRHEERNRLLAAALDAAEAGDIVRILATLADDPVLIADGYAGGVDRPAGCGQPKAVSGRDRVAAVVAALGRRKPRGDLRRRECCLNGEPAIVVLRDGQAYAALLASVADAKISQIFVHGDPLGVTFRPPARSSE